MFFVLSKVFWLIFQPSHLVVFLAVTTAILLLTNRTRPARWCGVVTAGLLLLFGCSPLGLWMMRALENTYTRPAELTHIDGILILGSSNNTAVLLSRGVYGQDRAMTRLVSGYTLTRRHPEARVVFSGGSGEMGQRTLKESVTARDVLLALGLAPSRLTLEDKSRNTWENLVFSKQIVKPKPGETWVLATSAHHLPRAIGIAKKVGWTMLPWPTDYFTTRTHGYHFAAVVQNLELTDSAVREYIGIWVYRASGKST